MGKGVRDNADDSEKARVRVTKGERELQRREESESERTRTQRVRETKRTWAPDLLFYKKSNNINV